MAGNGNSVEVDLAQKRLAVQGRETIIIVVLLATAVLYAYGHYRVVDIIEKQTLEFRGIASEQRHEIERTCSPKR